MTNEELRDIRDQIKALQVQRLRILATAVARTGFKTGDRVRGTLEPFLGFEGNLKYIKAQSPTCKIIAYAQWHIDQNGQPLVSNHTNHYMYSWARVQIEGIVLV